MAAIKVTTAAKVAVKYLRARCGVRYWEDATVNGETDEDGSRIPCRKGDDWCPLIELESGQIEGWPEGCNQVGEEEHKRRVKQPPADIMPGVLGELGEVLSYLHSARAD